MRHRHWLALALLVDSGPSERVGTEVLRYLRHESAGLPGPLIPVHLTVRGYYNILVHLELSYYCL